MHKVVVERPRWNPGRGKYGRRANLPDELLPKFEGIKRPHSRRKGLTDLLGPLRRWLHSQLGRPWNDFYSEACAVIKPDSVIRAHIKTHLLEFVERHTFMHNGKVCLLDKSYRGGVKPVTEIGWRRSVFFVHPESGLLQPIPRLSKRAWRAREPQPPRTIHWIGKNAAVHQIRGLWFECRFEVVPVNIRFKAYDHALERIVSRGELTRHDKQYSLCTLKRQLSKRELHRFGLRNAPILISPERSLQAVPPAIGWRLRFVLQRAVDCGLSEPGSGGLIPPRGAFRGGVTSALRAIPKSLSCPLTFDGPKTSGYLSLVRLQSGAQAAPVAQLVEQSPRRPLPICNFITARAAMIQPQPSTTEAVWHTTMNGKNLTSKSPANVAKVSPPRRR
jgi:hypothetical protein